MQNLENPPNSKRTVRANSPDGLSCTKALLRAQESLHILFHICNAADSELVDENFGHVWLEEGRERRPQVNVFYAKIQQGQQFGLES
ncbi:hypothetical protein P0100_24225 [Yersinia pestis]|nr:hypothetical protein [Yersinia pestis]